MRLARQLLSVPTMIQFSRRFISLTTLLVLVGFAGSASAQDKIDRSLREGRTKSHTQRVIIKAKAGYSSWVRQLLAQRGKQIESEMPSIDAIAVDLTSAELDAICLHVVTDGCSGDVLVSPSAVRTTARAAKAAPAVLRTAPRPIRCSARWASRRRPPAAMA